MDIQALNEKFQDLSRSVVQGIYDSDPVNASKLLEEISNQNPGIAENSKIRMKEDFAQQFKNLEPDEIEETLISVNYNEESAVMALLDLIEKKAQLNEENAKKKREQEEERVKAEALQQVQALFENIPKEEIQVILDNNFGHVNRTIDALLQRIKAKEEETQTENRRQRLITDLATRFNVDKSKSRNYLEKNNWELEIAVQQLSRELLDEKFAHFSKIFPDLDHNAIIGCLGFDDPENLTRLMMKREQKRKEKEDEEKRAQRLIQIEKEETERRERAARDRLEEERRREQEIRETEDEKKKQEAIRLEREKEEIKLAEEKKRLEEEEIRLKEEQEAKRKSESKNAEEQLAKLALNHSVIIQTILKADIEKESQINDMVNKEVRENLGSYLRPVLGRQPGVIPQKVVERKQQDIDIGHTNEPVIPIDTKKPVTKPEDNTQSKVNNTQSSSVVKLELGSKVVDWKKYIILKWEHSVSATSSDWIGIYKKGETNNQQYITYSYVTIDNNGKSGSMEFVAPSYSGEYEFRYFTFGTYNVFGVSETFKVGPQFELRAEIVNQSNIKIHAKQLTTSSYSFKYYIAMYSNENQPHNTFYTYQWVTPDVPTNFAIPKCGKWYFRLFTNVCRYDYCGGACDVFVEGNDIITLNQTSDSLIVMFDLKSVDLSYDAPWLGIFRKDETLMNQYDQYKYLSGIKGEFRMNKLRGGEWEARLYCRDETEPIAKSNSLHVK